MTKKSKKIIPFKTDKPSSPINRVESIKQKLDKKLNDKKAQETYIQRCRSKLLSTVVSTLLLSSIAITGWVYASKNTETALHNHQQLSDSYASLEADNQALTRDNARLQGELDALKQQAHTLSELNDQLMQANAQFADSLNAMKDNHQSVIVKLEQAHQTIRQLEITKSAQARAFKNLSDDYQTLEQEKLTVEQRLNSIKQTLAEHPPVPATTDS